MAPAQLGHASEQQQDPGDAAREERELRRAQAEREAAAQAQREKLFKKAVALTNTIRKFLAAWTAARQAEIDAVKAAQARKGKKGSKGKKAKAAAAPAGKDGKKKPPKTPVVEAWAGFMTSLDELVNKNKRVNLEDMYRGVELLEGEELVAFRRIVLTANKKVLPTEGMNINQLMMKEALFAAAAAHSYPNGQATISPSMGLAALRDRGLSAKQLLSLGFKEGDMLRVGFSKEDTIEASVLEPAKLRVAGLTAADLQQHGLPPELQGYRGIERLKDAGYTAAELVQAGLDNAWDLRRAGFTLDEAASAGVPVGQLRRGGYGDPEHQPAGFLGASMGNAQHYDARTLPMALGGTTGDKWQRLLQPQASVLATADRPTAGRSAPSFTAAARSSAAHGQLLRPSRPSAAMHAISEEAANGGSLHRTASGLDPSHKGLSRMESTSPSVALEPSSSHKAAMSRMESIAPSIAAGGG